jgi:hypothetical protein
MSRRCSASGSQLLRRDGEGTVGLDAGDDEHDIDDRLEAVGRTTIATPSDDPAPGPFQAVDARVRAHVDAVGAKLVGDEPAEFRIDGREDLGKLFDLGDVDAAGGKGFGLLRPM